MEKVIGRFLSCFATHIGKALILNQFFSIAQSTGRYDKYDVRWSDIPPECQANLNWIERKHYKKIGIILTLWSYI